MWCLKAEVKRNQIRTLQATISRRIKRTESLELAASIFAAEHTTDSIFFKWFELVNELTAYVGNMPNTIVQRFTVQILQNQRNKCGMDKYISLLTVYSSRVYQAAVDSVLQQSFHRGLSISSFLL